MIYVPNKEDYECIVVKDKDTIRAYYQTPVNNADISYRDFYVNSHYLYRDDSQRFTTNTSLPNCISDSLVSSSLYYRNDIFEILIILHLFLFVCYFFIKTCLKTLFFGWRA